MEIENLDEKLESAVSQPEESSGSEEPNGEETKTAIDWWNPETWGDTPPKEIVKNIQTKYNENSTRLKDLEREYQSSRENLEKIVADVKKALADPKEYYAQRKALGYVDDVNDDNTIDFNKLETADDVKNALKAMKDTFEQKIENIRKSAEMAADNKIRQAIDPISKERWSVALGKMNEQYGDYWSKVENKVARAITEGKYAYSPGMEKEVLEKAFRAECPDEYEAIIAENLKKKALEKSKAITKTPKKSPHIQVKSKSSGLDYTSMIAKANERLGR